MTVLNTKDKTAIRSSATRSVLEKTDRILRQELVDVRFDDTGRVPAPAYTDGRTITISTTFDPVKSSLRNGFTQKSMMITTGLNYHELAHCMFTPRFNTPLMNRVVSNGYMFTANVLEDQLAETRFVQLYRPASRYFTALVSNFMMENQEYLASNYVLVSGRLFLPKKLRELFKDRFSHPEKIDDIDALVAEYKTLLHPADDDRMFQIIKDLHHLLNDVDHSGESLYHNELTRGGIDDKAAKEVIKRKEYTPDDEDDEEQATATDDEGDEDEGSSVSEEEADGGEGQGGAERETSSEDEPTEEGEEGGKQPGENGGDSAGDEDGEKFPGVEDRSLEKALEETLEDTIEEIGEELDDRIQNIKQEEQNYKVEFEEQGHNTDTPNSDINSVVVRCQEEFRRVQVQHTPGWNTQQRHGKLNPRQYAKALQGSENVFKRWREGVHDALDFEVVFLLDQSGSMWGKIDTASKSLWALKRTFEELDGTVTVLGFAYRTTLLSQRGDRAHPGEIPIYFSGGGTHVSEALAEANRILSISMKKLKLTVVISDGGFSDDRAARAIVEKMTNPVAFVGIQQDVSEWQPRKNVVHAQTIDEPLELVDVVKNLALRLSDERLKMKGLT